MVYKPSAPRTAKDSLMFIVHSKYIIIEWFTVHHEVDLKMLHSMLHTHKDTQPHNKKAGRIQNILRMWKNL